MGEDPSSIAVDSMQSRAAVADAAMQGGQHQRLLRRAIAATVRASSRSVNSNTFMLSCLRIVLSAWLTGVLIVHRRQAVAGLFSAGPLRSLQYVWQKVVKAWHSA